MGLHDRLAGIEQWIQRADEELLYDPDGANSSRLDGRFFGRVAFWELSLRYQLHERARGVSCEEMAARRVPLCADHAMMHRTEVTFLAHAQAALGIDAPPRDEDADRRMFCYPTMDPCALCQLYEEGYI